MYARWKISDIFWISWLIIMKSLYEREAKPTSYLIGISIMFRFIWIDWLKPTGAGSSHTKHLQTKSKLKSNVFWNKLTSCLLWAPFPHVNHPSSDLWDDCWGKWISMYRSLQM
jgi:hypothetical protein